MTAIAWRKKSFRKYFDGVSNWIAFHKLAHRLLEAPTVAITHLIQDEIVEWLGEIKETRARDWFRSFWTGEFGNYTNATAGYCGFNKASGIEGDWKYLRRDTIGTSGTNKRMSIKNFVPSLVQYVGDYSKRHASKIFDKVTGIHKFPSVPEVSSSMWGKVQKCQLHRLLLSAVDGPASVKAMWQRELDWFHTVEIEDGTTITELIQQYRMSGNVMGMARTGIPAITMPTLNYLKSLKEVESYVKAEEEVNQRRSNFELLFKKPDDYKVMFPMNSPEDTLDLMDSFNYIKPLHKKSGQMVWLCSCADAYQSYCCVESVILSLLFNPELEVPDIASLKQLKDRERAARANPFTAATFDAEKLKEKERQKAEKLEPNWQPTLATFSAAHASSALAKAVHIRQAVKDAVAPVTADKDKDGDAAGDVPDVDRTDAAVAAPPRGGKRIADDMIDKELQRSNPPFRLIPKVQQKGLGRRARPERPVRAKGAKPVKDAKVRCLFSCLRT